LSQVSRCVGHLSRKVLCRWYTYL